MAIPGMDRKAALGGRSEYQDIFESSADGIIISDITSGCVLQANPAACRMHGYTREQMIGAELSSLIHAEARRQFNDNLRTFHPDSAFDTWTRLLRKDGSTSYSRWRGTSMEYRGHRCMLWSVRDVSERIHAEQTLRQRLQSQAREQTAMLGISKTLASTLEFPPGLILDQLQELIPYDRAAFFALDGPALVTMATRGKLSEDPAAPIRVHLQGPETLTVLFNANQPIRIGNVWGKGWQAAELRALLGEDASILLDGMQSWMWVPMAVREGILGGLGVVHARKSFYTAHHASLALGVAHQAVTSLVHTELYRNAQSAAAEDERKRLAQSLHDAVNQSLFSAGLIAEVLPEVWDRDQELARRSLEDLRRLMRGANADMRALLAELRPSTITDAEMGALLQLLNDAFTGRTNIPVELTVGGEGSLPGEIQLAIYRICQEALANVAMHADARRVQMVLYQDGSSVELSICDDGRGFDPDGIAPGHFGLHIMRERAEAVGASLLITSQAGRGTALNIRWPAGSGPEVG